MSIQIIQSKLDSYNCNSQNELAAYGYNIEIGKRSDEDDSLIKILHLSHLTNNDRIKKIKIKLEIDTNPPLNGNTEIKYLDFLMHPQL